MAVVTPAATFWASDATPVATPVALWSRPELRFVLRQLRCNRLCSRPCRQYDWPFSRHLLSSWVFRRCRWVCTVAIRELLSQMPVRPAFLLSIKSYGTFTKRESLSAFELRSRRRRVRQHASPTQVNHPLRPQPQLTLNKHHRPTRPHSRSSPYNHTSASYSVAAHPNHHASHSASPKTLARCCGGRASQPSHMCMCHVPRLAEEC
jgi:hypothetical protein